MFCLKYNQCFGVTFNLTFTALFQTGNQCRKYILEAQHALTADYAVS